MGLQDFSLQAIAKNIPIFYWRKAIVVHYGRTNFYVHMEREISRGMDAYKISKYWNRSGNKNLLKAMFNKQIIWKKWKDEKELKNELKKEIFNQKNISFKLKFNLLMLINKLINSVCFKLGISY